MLVFLLLKKVLSALSYGHFTAAKEFWSQCHIFGFGNNRRSSRKGLLGRQNYVLSQKSVPQGPFGRIKSADLRFGVLEPSGGETVGGGLPPPHPPPPGPPRRNRWAQFVYSHSLRKLGPNFGSNPKILPRPASNTFSSTFCNFTRRGLF